LRDQVQIRVASVLVAICLAVVACGGHAKRPVTAAEWKAVITDWLDDGRITERHSCEAVRAAELRLPVTTYSHAPQDLRRYEAKVC
jgi:hypothetical protein